MKRLVNAAHPIHDLLSQRWSPRSFADRPVGGDTLRTVLEAARWAPSASNEQPWSFLVATKDQPADYQMALSCLVERNQVWAKTAPVLIIAVATLNFRKNNAPNRHAFYDLGQAVAYLSMQATALDLFVHQMAGFSADAARSAFAIPASDEAVTAIAVGYLGAAEQLPPDFAAREAVASTRRGLSEFVYAGKWGQAAAWASK